MNDIDIHDIPAQAVDFIRRALDEDIGHGDITTACTVDSRQRGTAEVIAKEDLVLAGLPFFIRTFLLIDPKLEINNLRQDGQAIAKGEVFARICGRTASILTAERVALNIIQRLCGIATLTLRFMKEVEGLPVKIVDTRKTTPNMRTMEKYAVRMGTGSNHRFGLYDGLLIKDNHIKAAGGIRQAIEMARARPLLTRIEVEVSTIEELGQALKEDIDIIMLDNMTIAQMSQAVRLVRSTKKVLLEASGNVSLANVRLIAQTGVDIISVGSITHSAPASDISLNLAPC